MGVDLLDVDIIRRELAAAYEEAVASLVREGLDLEESREEAREYVGFPQEMAVEESVLVDFQNAVGGESVNPEFVEICAAIQLGTCYVWDADFRLPRSIDEVTGNHFLDSVIDQTILVRGRASVVPLGLAIGSTAHGDIVFARAEGTDDFSVLVLDHNDGRLMFEAASTILDYILVNASIAASYWRRMESGSVSIDWAAEILEEIGSEVVNADWVRYSLAQRPRPT